MLAKETGVKMFQLRMATEFHTQLKQCAQDNDSSLHQFILDTLGEKIKLNEEKKSK